MNWNTDITKIFKQKNEIYPTKKDMNLYFKVNKTTALTTILLYVLFFVVLVLGASKVFIYDKIQEVAQLRQTAASLDTEIEGYQKKLKRYPDVLEEFTRYAPTKQELLHVNRMEILNMVDSIIRPVADVSDISIEGNQVLVTFSGVTLERTAQIVAALDKSPIVKKTSVDTAFSSERSKEIVDVNILIEVSKGDES